MSGKDTTTLALTKCHCADMEIKHRKPSKHHNQNYCAVCMGATSCKAAKTLLWFFDPKAVRGWKSRLKAFFCIFSWAFHWYDYFCHTQCETSRTHHHVSSTPWKTSQNPLLRTRWKKINLTDRKLTLFSTKHLLTTFSPAYFFLTKKSNNDWTLKFQFLRRWSAIFQKMNCRSFQLLRALLSQKCRFLKRKTHWK